MIRATTTPICRAIRWGGRGDARLALGLQPGIGRPVGARVHPDHPTSRERRGQAFEVLHGHVERRNPERTQLDALRCPGADRPEAMLSSGTRTCDQRTHDAAGGIDGQGGSENEAMVMRESYGGRPGAARLPGRDRRQGGGFAASVGSAPMATTVRAFVVPPGAGTVIRGPVGGPTIIKAGTAEAARSGPRCRTSTSERTPQWRGTDSSRGTPRATAPTSQGWT